jgi:hypothetical protein
MRFMRTARTALIFALAALVLPAAASASTGKQYVLLHPGREHCRAHYVKKVERVKGRKEIVCVYVAPKLETFVLITDAQGSVSGSVHVVGGHDLIGVPITYTITNEGTGQSLGSFMEPSDPVQPCALVLTVDEDTPTFAGEPVPPDPACPITVSLPTGQLAVLSGSFAGNSTYAPSVSEGKGI